MRLDIRTSGDLTPIDSALPHRWSSSGDDPFFDVRFKTVRPPILVAFFQSTDGDLIEPKIYLNRGRGYRERDTIQHEPGQAFVLTADVGRIGLVRSLRIDPSSQPGEFAFSIEAFPDWNTAEKRIQDRLQSDMANATRWDIGQVPRYRPKLPAIRLPKYQNETKTFVELHHRMARSLPTLQPEPNEKIWLSIVVPVYNAPKRYLDDLVRSFEAQAAERVELILSDDASTSQETIRCYKGLSNRKGVKIVRNSLNGGIAQATNAGLAEASGKWITFLDHDDLIAPGALKVIAKAIIENPRSDFFYTDEVVVNDRLVPSGLMLKPAFDPVLLTGVNYVNHFSIFRHNLLNEIGYVRTGFDGSQDYDLLLRYLRGIPEDRVCHIPYPAYWWRRTGETYSRRFMERATDAARRALVDRFAGDGENVSVSGALTRTLHRVDFAQPSETEWPKISIIIPSRDGYDLVRTVLNGLFNDTDYPNFEVIIIDNGSNDKRVLALYTQYKDRWQNFRVSISEEKFNFARAINRGFEEASGEHFLVLNNDIGIVDPGWLKEMVSCLKFDATGIVGAKLLYPNNRIQHAGVIVGFGGLAGHWYLNKPVGYGGPMNRLHLRNSVTCVTGAAMLISGDCRRAIGSWDEENFAIAYNDVDYCMRAHKAGFRIIWTPFACFYHHESASRGSDLIGERKRRFDKEKENLRLIHGTDTFEDPAINPGYEKRHSTPGLEMPMRLASVRAGLRAHHRRPSENPDKS